jgi:hypothetical protein
MASYIIAGKADDVSFARAEFAAKQIEAACPNIFFHYEMKHPDMWSDFVKNVFRKYDFVGFPDDFPGPLIWTHEGDLIGSSAEFIQHVCVDKFGIPAPPPVTDPSFKDIAKDNLKQVKLQKDREKHGPPFGERCDAAFKKCMAAGLFAQRLFDEQKRVIVQGSPMEVWISSTLHAERVKLREDYGKGESMQIGAGLKVAIAGHEQTHVVLLHPRPLVQKHLVLAPQRFVKEVAGAEGQMLLDVPPHTFRSDVTEDLGEADFTAAMEIMSSMGGVPGVACWMGLRGSSEYRSPLDTHLQVLPFPLHSAGEDSPLRFPLELICDKALKDGHKTLKAFSFMHTFSALSEKSDPKALGKEALQAYEQARGKPGNVDSVAVAFTTSWMLLVPLMPPDIDSAQHETWLQMPVPPPCALCGIMVCPVVAKTFPETANLLAAPGAPLVSTRAVEEGIPEDSPEFAEANRQVRIATKIMDMPVEILGVWTCPGNP